VTVRAEIGGMTEPEADAYSVLVDAMDRERPSCRDDDRYTLDPAKLTKGDHIEMGETCALCPLLAACKAYATAFPPASGYWAGRQYGVKGTR
jgi:hypothetical protein